jgi:superfamily II DNA helicase RecQ
LASPEASHTRRLILDECHEFSNPHPERVAIFRQFGALCASLKLQRLHITASHPEHLHKNFCKHAYVLPSTRLVRASTDRPELGYHCIQLYPQQSKISVGEATRRLAHKLKSTLLPEERMIVFFKDQMGAEFFAHDMRCPIYHSKLPAVGNNTKGYNLWQWDSGQCPMIAATTALLQGIDRPYVKYVIFHDGTYGAISYHQGGGRAGRAGQFAYTFVVFDASMVRIREYRGLTAKDPQVISTFATMSLLLSDKIFISALVP